MGHEWKTFLKTRIAMTTLEWTLVIVLFIACLMIVPPMFMQGRSRSPVSRVRADQRSLATAIESYYQDHNLYPGTRPIRELAVKETIPALKSAGGWDLATVETGGARIDGLTTPISYLTSMFPDPFTPRGKPSGFMRPFRKKPSRSAHPLPFAYYTDRTDGWIVISPGPDLDYDITQPELVYNVREKVPGDALLLLTYDPTNGTDSNGDVYRFKQ